MTQASLAAGLAQVGIPSELTNVAASPEQAVLVAVGTLIILFSAGLFGLLTAGAVLDWIAKGFPSGNPPPEHRR